MKRTFILLVCLLLVLLCTLPSLAVVPSLSPPEVQQVLDNARQGVGINRYAVAFDENTPAPGIWRESLIISTPRYDLWCYARDCYKRYQKPDPAKIAELAGRNYITVVVLFQTNGLPILKNEARVALVNNANEVILADALDYIGPMFYEGYNTLAVECRFNYSSLDLNGTYQIIFAHLDHSKTWTVDFSKIE